MIHEPQAARTTTRRRAWLCRFAWFQKIVGRLYAHRMRPSIEAVLLYDLLFNVHVHDISEVALIAYNSIALDHDIFLQKA